MGNDIRFILTKLHKKQIQVYFPILLLDYCLFRFDSVFHCESSHICWLRMLNITYMTFDCFIGSGATADHQNARAFLWLILSPRLTS